MQRLRVLAATTFVLDAGGRIVRENDPDASPGPRVCFAGCAEGNLALVRHDAPRETSRDVLELLDAEPPWVSPEARPAGLAEVIYRLLQDAPVRSVEALLTYALPKHAAPADGLAFICSGTDQGDALLARLARDGMPSHMVEAGFLGLEDFWPPWCVAVEDQAIAAIAFAARLGEQGASAGVYTFPGYRGRGLAAAVTAQWSSLPDLEDRELFYTTAVTNTSSQRVAQRLGLQRFGLELRIT